MVNAMTPNPELVNVPAAADFVHRHIGPSPADMRKMLETVGVSSIDELIEQTVPNTIRQRPPLDLGPALSETEVLQKLGSMASNNKVLTTAQICPP
jgi:glycine dehydrogenase